MTFRKKPMAFATGALASMLLIVAGINWLRPGAGKPSPDPGSPEIKNNLAEPEANGLVARKNAALAALENRDFQVADPLFAELATAGTGEPLGPRNWLINRLLAVAAINETAEPERYTQALDRARSAQSLEQRLERHNAVHYYLAAKLNGCSHNPQGELYELRRGAVNDSIDPVVMDALYSAQRDSADASVRDESVGALRGLSELVPENLHVLIELLSAQARLKDAAIPQTLEQALRLLPGFLTDSADDKALSAQIDRAAAAAKSANWQEVSTAVSAIVSAADKPPLAAPVEADRRRLARPLTWYAPTDFSPSFYAKHNLDRVLSPERPHVHFRDEPSQGPLAMITDVKEARFVEGDANERPAIAVLRAAAFEVYRRARAGDGWSLAAAAALPRDGFRHFIVADLQEPRGLSPRSSLHMDRGGDQPRGSSFENAKPSPDFVLFGSSGVAVLDQRFVVDSPGGSSTQRFHTLNPAPAEAVAVLDFDNDGLLDLVVAQAESAGSNGLSIWRNRGNLEFQDVSRRSPVATAAIRTKALIAVDWNHDFDPDLMIVGGGNSGRFGYLAGLGEGRFQFRPIDKLDPAFSQATTLAVLDADANGSWDLLAAGPAGMTLLRTASTQPGQLEILGSEKISDFAAQRFLVTDYDNDGRQDLVAWSDQGARCFHGKPDGHFVPADDVLPADLRPISSVDEADIDGDGDRDLVVVTRAAAGGRVRILVNEGGNANNWLDVRLDANTPSNSGPKASPINRWGSGSTVQLKTGPVCQSQIGRGRVIHFGLGKRDAADVLRILWSNGTPSNVLRPAKNRSLLVQPPDYVLKAGK